MGARQFTNRLRLVVVAVALAIATFGATSSASAANPNGRLDVTACVTSDGNLQLTGVWSNLNVAAWSWFTETTDGSGGLGAVLDQPTRSGSFSNTFLVDPNTVLSVTGTVSRARGSSFVELASVTLTQPLAGWPDCGSAAVTPNFSANACVDGDGNLRLTATWSGVRVTFFGWSVEASDGSGGLAGPVATPGRSGTFTNTFIIDPATVSSVTASVSREQGSNFITVGMVTLTQPVSGWPVC
jgi:hypothetical protein